jgi:hypothetical protein
MSQVKWRKSTRSSGQGGNCVEVGVIGDPRVAACEVTSDELHLVRDSKDPEGAVLAFPPADWDAFIRGIKNGELNCPGT